MKHYFLKYKLLFIPLFIAFFSLSLTFYDDGDDFELVKNLDIYHSLVRDLKLLYVDEIDVGHLIETSMVSMLKSLDPYTVYYPESQIDDYKFMTTGAYGGIGIQVHRKDNQVVISNIYKGYPADRAGLLVGDVILKIQERAVNVFNMEEVSNFLKGVPKTKIMLEIHRYGNTQNQLIEVDREQISMLNVPYYAMLNENTGYIKLSGFTPGAGNEVEKALLELKTNNNLTSIVLDLRGNPGGLLIEAVNIVNIFVDKGEEVVSTRGKMKQWNKTIVAQNEPVDVEIPLIVLVNSNSASASEIVSGAIQDLDRGVVIGQRTYGKGLVQATRDLSFGTKLKITTAKYYIPSGRCIQAIDYTHANNDGSVGKIPDSLITQFSTRNGRIVFDGGGIYPDVFVPKRKLSIVSKSLLLRLLIFDYATIFRQDNSSIASPKDFIFTDSDFSNFTKFLQTQKFTYQTQSEIVLDSLISIAEKEKYFDLAKNEFDVLKQKLQHDQNKDLQIFRDEIKLLLTSEIISRYYFQNGRTEYSLLQDQVIRIAIKVLNNQAEYNILLSF